MIVKSVVLPLRPDAAFDLFTQRINDWWPPDRRHTRDPESEIFLLASGRFFERARDGQEAELGHVRSWNPPHLIVLDFFIATGPEHPTEVEIAFSPSGEGAAVTVTHRPKPSSESLWPERSPRYAPNWEAVLTGLSKAACLS
jgi:hypothetical protein